MEDEVSEAGDHRYLFDAPTAARCPERDADVVARRK
jgi:hypothetical protein